MPTYQRSSQLQFAFQLEKIGFYIITLKANSNSIHESCLISSPDVLHAKLASLMWLHSSDCLKEVEYRKCSMYFPLKFSGADIWLCVCASKPIIAVSWRDTNIFRDGTRSSVALCHQNVHVMHKQTHTHIGLHIKLPHSGSILSITIYQNSFIISDHFNCSFY